MDEITAIVVDDDLDAVESITDSIESRGIKVIGKGRDGKDAIDLYEKLKPKISLLDIMMPRYDGFYAAEYIRAKAPGSKIIMVTADPAHETAIKLEKLNLDHVYKPYDLDDIMDHIGKQLDST